jgi:predicted RNA-binding Zn ribbon-like protein
MSPTLSPPSRAGTLPLVGNALALDFANTASGRGGPQARDHLRAAKDVIAWADHAAILPAADGASLRIRLAAQPTLATDLLDRALALRAVLFTVALAQADGRAPDPASVAALSALYAATVAQARLVPRDGAYAWTWDVAASPVEAVLGPILLSALTLLTQPPSGRLKECDGQHCGWLFIDTTKNGRRRWCEMEVCGNRAKQRRRRGDAVA